MNLYLSRCDSASTISFGESNLRFNAFKILPDYLELVRLLQPSPRQGQHRSIELIQAFRLSIWFPSDVHSEL